MQQYHSSCNDPNTYVNENWKGYTILLSSVEKESTAEKFGVSIPSSYVEEDSASAAVEYNRYLNNKVRCTPGMLAGVVEKRLDFALIAPKTRMLKKQLKIKWFQKIRIGVRIKRYQLLETYTKYHVFVLA